MVKSKAQQTPQSATFRGRIYRPYGSNYGYSTKSQAKRIAKSQRKRGHKAIVRKIVGKEGTWKGKVWWMVYQRN